MASRSSISSTYNHFATNNTDYSSPFSPSTSHEDNLSSFQHALLDYSGAAGKKAVLSALVETALENRGNTTNEEVTPNELFIAILSALNSLVVAVENKCKSDEGEGCEKEIEALVPLLELLRRIAGFVVYWGNNSGALFGEVCFVVCVSLVLLL
jgi:hypothetical protein